MNFRHTILFTVAALHFRPPAGVSAASRVRFSPVGRPPRRSCFSKSAPPLHALDFKADSGSAMHLRSTLSLLVLLPLAASAQEVPIPKPGTGTGPAATPEARVPVRLDALTLEPEIRSKIDAFFAVLKQRKVPDAYRRLLEGSTLAEENPELVKKLEESTIRVLDLTGRIDATEILRIRAAGKSIREITYVLNGEKRPLRWKFYFYLSEGHWQVLDTNVATEAAGFFDDGK